MALFVNTCEGMWGNAGEKWERDYTRRRRRRERES